MNPHRKLFCLVLAGLAPAFSTGQTSAPPIAPAPSPAASDFANSAADNSSNQAPVVLTPFEVTGTQDHGYFAPNTLAGTRLNNNIADIPGSVTVVTKQELLDTNSWNINDVFRYQANTEGASTFTPTPLVRSNVSDILSTQLLVSGNRVRGLASADLEVDNFFSLSRLPFDSYNSQSLEVDRGPNSILFGTGSPAGIVNQSRNQAVLGKLSGDFSLTGGSYGTFRDTAAVNIPIGDKVAIYLAQAYTSEGFRQKPSADITRREYAAFTIVPFNSHKTKLSGSFEYYNNYNNDPNAVTPVDFVTPWLQSGRPVYNPLNDMVTYLGTGKQVGPYALNASMPNYSGILQSNLNTATSPYFVPSLAYVNGGHFVQGIASNGATQYFYKGQQTGFSVQTLPSPLTPAQALVDEELLTTSVNLPLPSNFVVWQTPSVTSKSVYDWSTINASSPARAYTNARTYYLNLEQELFPHLNLDVGWFRQELHQLADQPLSQANATTLAVDTNQYLLDGRPNPMLGTPYLDAYQSDSFLSPEINNNYRASLEYELDLREMVPGWLKWLGHHRFMAVYSQHDDVQTNLRFREAIIGGDPNYLPTAATLANPVGYGFGNSNNALEEWLYMGNGPTNGYGAAAPARYGRPGIFSPVTLPIETYNYAAGNWGSSNIVAQSVLFPTGGLQENLQDQKTYFWEPFLWNDRIVGTLGINDDQVKNRQTVFPTTNPLASEYNAQGFPNPAVWYREGPWQYVGGNTSTTGLVVHPFKHWSAIDAAATEGNWAAGFLRTLSFTFNRSDNFNPPPAFYTDFYGNPLAKPTGREKDYGLEIATPDNKFFLRATWFNTQNLNQPVGDTSNGRAYYIDATELRNWATTVVEIRNALAGTTNAAGTPYPLPSDTNFQNLNLFPVTAAMQQQVSAITGFPYTYGPGQTPTGGFANPFETEDGFAHGVELEAVYNPIPNLRMKVSWGYQKTILTNIAEQAYTFVSNRAPTWSSFSANDLSTVYTKSNGTPLYVGNFLGGYGYDGNITQPSANGWTTVQNYYNIVVASQLATDRALNGTQAQNQRDYSWSYLTSYDFKEGWRKGFSVGGALRFYGKAIAGYYGDFVHLNATGQVVTPNINAPIYYPAEYHLDAWLSYQFRLPWSGGRIHAMIQLNGSDLNISNQLEPVSYNYDGSPAAERIIPGRNFSITTRFGF
jgi:hypothetical protein